jgi:hypothetical protein
MRQIREMSQMRHTTNHTALRQTATRLTTVDLTQVISLTMFTIGQARAAGKARWVYLNHMARRL